MLEARVTGRPVLHNTPCNPDLSLNILAWPRYLNSASVRATERHTPNTYIMWSATYTLYSPRFITPEQSLVTVHKSQRSYTTENRLEGKEFSLWPDCCYSFSCCISQRLPFHREVGLGMDEEAEWNLLQLRLEDSAHRYCTRVLNL